ncbi:3-oxoacyl-ACP reductase [Tomitella gaofuii]|uniref:3-oxoacyl-ACP reductase n=1 Tax=Tomitella gaofuii TaxID=2760083 RepID=UPI0015FCABB7|nr:3-oxoacyl-ACP reductase [Tomitella gaofuii]
MADELSLAGKAAVVTGAGAGLGRSEALALADAGAAVVINDMTDRADEVVSEIVAAGGKAVAVKGDVSDWTLAQSMIDTAVSQFGSMDILVNNAGITRDTMIFNLTEDKWDDVLRVHLKGHAATSHAASVHWRNLSKETGQPVYGRVVNTASEAFLFGPAGQPNYGAAKAGIVALTLSTANGMHKYGVKANAICPRARTEMTADTFDANTASGVDPLAPERVGTLVRYLSSPASHEITGQVFVVYGNMVTLMDSPKIEHKFVAADGTFTPQEMNEQLSAYFAGRDRYNTYAAYSLAAIEKDALKTE